MSTPRRLLSPWILSLALPAGAQTAGEVAGTAAPAPVSQRIEIRGAADNETEQRRRDPVAKSIVGREELDKYGDPSVADVLKRQPGVNLQGGSPRLRGLGAGYTLILVNGEPAPPGFSLDNLPPSQVERIEITKGPTAEHSTQAVAGTINIVLRSAPRQRQRELLVRLGYTRYQATPGFSATWGDRLGNLSAVLPLNGYQWRGGNHNDRERLTRDATPAQDLQRLSIDGFDRWWGGGFSFGPRLNWRVSDETTLEWHSYLQRNEYHDAGSYRTTVLEGVAPASVDDRSRGDGHWQTGRTGLSLNRRWADGARLEARVGSQAMQNRSFSRFVGADAAGRVTVLRETATDIREQSRSSAGKFTQPWREDHTLALGWDLEHKWRTETRAVEENGVSQLADFEARPFDAQVSRVAAFVQDEWQIAPRWSAYLGVRAESLLTRSRDEAAATSLRTRSAVVTPVLHLTHRFDARGRDLLRASLTRSYKAPELSALLARPQINSAYPAAGGNAEIAPDRIGNPALAPELATGLDLALEKYLPRGGVLSVGVFHRQIEGLIRWRTSLQAVSWSPVPRWVSQPVNLESATSTGLELEVKGRVDELLVGVPLLPADLNLRGALSLYRSAVSGIPGPDNRLEQQQPWSLTLGFDHRVAGTPLGLGANLAYLPSYVVQQTDVQRRLWGRTRNLDAYLAWHVSPAWSWRLSASNLPHSRSEGRTETVSGGTLLWEESRVTQRARWNLGLSMKL